MNVMTGTFLRLTINSSETGASLEGAEVNFLVLPRASAVLRVNHNKSDEFTISE